MLRCPSAPFEHLPVHGESIILDVEGKILVIPTGNANVLPSFNEYVLNSNRLTTDFGGLTGSGSPDYTPGTIYTPTDGVYLSDVAGNNTTKTLTTGKLKDLNYLTVDTTAHSITEEFIVQNTSIDNTSSPLASTSSISGWTKAFYTDPSTLESVNGEIHFSTIANGSAALARKTITHSQLAGKSFISFKMRYAGAAPTGIYFRFVDSTGAIKSWNSPRFPITTTNSTYVFPILAPAGTTGVLCTSDNGFDVTKVSFFEIGLRGNTGTAYECWFSDIKVDTGKAAYVEMDVPDNLADVSLALQCWDGSTYQPAYTAKMDTVATLFSSSYTNLKYSDGSALNDVYGAVGAGQALYAKGESGGTVQGIGSTLLPTTMTYSQNKGTKKRIGIAVLLPPSDNGRTTFNQIRLKTSLSYVDSGSTSYAFEDSTNASYGLQNTVYPWIALYDPASNEIDFYLISYRSQNLMFARDENGVINSITLYPGNGNVYHGRITHCDPTRDSDSDLIPDCLSRSVEGSIANFLKSYGMVI